LGSAAWPPAAIHTFVSVSSPISDPLPFLVFQIGSVILLVLAAMVSAAPAAQQPEVPHALLDIETPNQFSYSPSPLTQPESLRSKPYFDFLSTLYAHDTAKSNLFRPYSRQRRDADARKLDRPRRAIVFRPLFVYKQQEIRRQEIKDRNAQRRHDLNRLQRL
ncbi:hypothetical protein KR038_002214, partial [Drosophila bunnanda]